MRPQPDGLRVLIVSASMGAGHDAVSAELARRLKGAGAIPTVVDLLGLAGAAGTRLRNLYHGLLDHAPWLYGAAMRFWARWPRPLEALTAANAAQFEAALKDAVDDIRPAAVVSTYNLASQSLGRLVRDHRIDVPVATLVTDPGPHPYWVAPWVGLHLVPSEPTAEGLRNYGARNVRVVAPLVRPDFALPPSRSTARAQLGLPDERIVLFNAGSWAAGKLERSLAAAGTDGLRVVLCGRDESLVRRLAGRPGIRAVPWTTQMAAYLSAADVVVDNAGGLTCWEALACKTPVVLFRPLPGHGVINARTLDASGWARYARTPAALQALVRTLQRRNATGPFDEADAVPHIVQLARDGSPVGRG